MPLPQAAVFVETTIQIGRLFHSDAQKRRIETRLKGYELKVSSLVVRQEFKRRVLKEAVYLIKLIDQRRTVPEVLHHLNETLPKPHLRKSKICGSIVASFLARNAFARETLVEQADRLRAYLEALIETGLQDFDELVDHVIIESGCAAGLTSIRQKGRRYDLGSDQCSRHEGCQIVRLLRLHVEALNSIKSVLAGLPEDQKTEELKSAEKFLDRFASDPERACSADPCWTVGDLMIAIESVGVPSFYTMNYKESQHLCRALGQELVVRSTHPEKDDVVHPAPEIVGAS